MQALKTGALIAASVEMGAILAHIPVEGRTALRGYARDIGLAFQIVDDIMDVEGDEAVAGKKLQKDSDAGKETFVSLMGLVRASGLGRPGYRTFGAIWRGGRLAAGNCMLYSGEGSLMAKRIGVYPGTFDPITLGHMDIIERGAKLVDELIIGVTTNIAKSPMFNDDERIDMVKREVAAVGNTKIHVVGFNSLLMDFAAAHGANVIIRGIRGVTDFEYEYQLTGMNRQLNDQIETIFLMADVALQPIASRLVKEIAQYGGEIGKFVTPGVRDDVVARVKALAG
jgi:pantetheine-phosphate adenylyltransferase